jgi:aminopeptidase N
MILTNIYILVDKYRLLFFLVVFSSNVFISNVYSLACKPRKKKTQKVELAPILVTAKDDIKDYKGAYTLFFDLLHTKLDVYPNFKDKNIEGTATLTLTPHFYSTNSLSLDAKGMIIHHVISERNNDTLPFVYTGKNIILTFPKPVTRHDTIVLRIRYTAQPYLLDSAIVQEGRGAYFINTEGKNKYKPMHLWTQGETEAASCWFPTIESTSQKCTQELYVTYPDTMVSFSNGKLISSVNNYNGTKTDYWKQNLPHSPYLFVLCIGPFKIYHDQWQGKPVQYFTFDTYFKDVHEVFGETAAMMDFFSTKFSTPFPWDKYNQVVLYDYTAGAMENTSASVFYEPMFASHYDLIDRDFEGIIAHELAHQWFGDLVTCESWANLTLNESFADYAEYLWFEFAMGLDEAYYLHYQAWQGYLDEARKKKIEPIVNYYYTDRWEIFDNHRYEKGGRVINMLRHYLGDEAFFEGLKKYLHDNAYKSTEVSDLRKAIEAVSGQDLNWFFNQWWFSKGHPQLDFRYHYDDQNKNLLITILQKQKDSYKKVPIFKLPIDIRIGNSNHNIDTTLWFIQDSTTFSIPLFQAPSWIIFDKDKILLSEKTIHQSDTAWVNSFHNATNYIDKVDAITALSSHQKDAYVRNFYLHAIKDSFWAVRNDVLTALLPIEWKNKGALSALLEELILRDPHPKVRTTALKLLRGINTHQAFGVALNRLEQDSSYSVKAEALQALRDSSSSVAYQWAKKYYFVENPSITSSIASIFADSANTVDFSFFERALSLQYYRTSSSLNDQMEKYMRGVNLATFEQCILLLADIYAYAENDVYKKKSLTIIKNLLEECRVGFLINDIYNKSGKLQLLEIHKQKFGL